MKTTAKSAKTAAKRADKGGSVPFDEMQRLMRVYGSTRCLRRRQASGGTACRKIESVKRKFYRWFPDLEERFVRDAGGFYRPRFGHAFEMRYREDLRARDGEILARKRTDRRKQRLGVGNAKKVAKKAASPSIREVTASVISSGAAIAPASNCAPVPSVSFRDIRDIDLKLETEGDRSASISIAPGTGPLDSSFVAKHGIFDDVERSFFAREDAEVQNSSTLRLVSDQEISDCPSLQSSTSVSSTSSDEEPCSSTSWGSDPHMDAPNFPVLPLVSSLSRGGASVDEGPRPGASRGDDSPFVDRDIDDMIGGSMEEYCEEILLSDGDGGCGPVFHFGAL